MRIRWILCWPKWGIGWKQICLKKLQVHTLTIKMLMRTEEVLDSVNITSQEKLQFPAESGPRGPGYPELEAWFRHCQLQGENGCQKITEVWTISCLLVFSPIEQEMLNCNRNATREDELVKNLFFQSSLCKSVYLWRRNSYNSQKNENCEKKRNMFSSKQVSIIVRYSISIL